MKYHGIYILGGGTVSYVRNHLALCAPAYGKTARTLNELVPFCGSIPNSGVKLILTRMADPDGLMETNDDVAAVVEEIIADQNAKLVFFNVALCDFDGRIGDVDPGKYAERLKTSDGDVTMRLTPADKIIGRIRQYRKDIFVVGFKTTTRATEDEQYLAGLTLLKKNSINLVLANDTVTRVNMIITPEEARYHVTKDRQEALENLVEMAAARSQLRFTRSTVVDAPTVPWNSSEVPDSLRTVVNHCIQRGAYKPFLGATVGHFAAKAANGTILTSIRKKNFNELDRVGLVRMETVGDNDAVIAYGAKPSVGGQSQRIVFTEHPDMDCIVHFHCPLKETGQIIPVRSQRLIECGSHSCGKNTSDGLALIEDGIKAVYLDNHGPNIVFNRNTDPSKVIAFIERNFVLEAKTGGLVA